MKMITWILIVAILCCVVGCSWLAPKPKPLPPAPVKPVTQLTRVEIHKQIVYQSVAWVQALMIVAICASIFAIALGWTLPFIRWLGLSGLTASGLCFALLSVITLYSQIIAGILFAGGLILAGYAIYVNRSAIKQIITGCEAVKTGTDLLIAQNAVQSPTTKKIVDAIQATLPPTQK